MDGKFKKQAFEEEALKKYLQTCQCYNSRNYRDMFNYVGNTLLTVSSYLCSPSKPKQRERKAMKILISPGICYQMPQSLN